MKKQMKLDGEKGKSKGGFNLLKTFIQYNNLELEIEILKEQIKLAENNLTFWFGKGIPFGSYGSHKFGINTALKQTDDSIDTINKLKEHLEHLEENKRKIDNRLKEFKGLEYQVAYKRYVEGKQLNEIADELNKSYEHIRRVHAKLKKNATFMLQTN